jgi:predicted DNA-binding transcriptional regulator AlpA
VPHQRPEVTGRKGEAALPAKLIFKDELLKLLGVTYGSLYAWMRDGKFPLAIEVGPRGGRSIRIAWLESEITEWLAARPRRQLRPTSNKKKVA